MAMVNIYNNQNIVAPVRERGLKSFSTLAVPVENCRRSREGAWIEIRKKLKNTIEIIVAPVRERGLKSEKS